MQVTGREEHRRRAISLAHGKICGGKTLVGELWSSLFILLLSTFQPAGEFDGDAEHLNRI